MHDESNVLFDKKYVLLGTDGIKFVCFCPLQLNIKSIKDGFPMSKPITECVECSHYLVSGTATAFAKELDINDYFYCTYKIDSLKDDKIHANQAEKFEKDLVDKIMTNEGKIYYFSIYNSFFDIETFEEISYSHNKVIEYNRKNASLFKTSEIDIEELRPGKIDYTLKNEIDKKYQKLINNQIVCSIQEFALEEDASYSVYNIKKNKEYIIQSTTWGYYYIIDYLHTGNYCLFDDIQAKEWRLTQVIKSFNGKLRNRVIWSMM